MERAIRCEVDRVQGGCRLVGAFVDVLGEPGAYGPALAQVSPYRRSKTEAFRFPRDRRLSLLAGLLLDELLRDRGLRERDMTYMEGRRGKPSFADFPDLHFSLAHGGRMAVAALADAPVGVDVEHLPTFPRDIVDPHLWTEMEAVGKVLGCGVGEYVDGRPYIRPDGLEVVHFPVNDHLVCLAQRVQ